MSDIEPVDWQRRLSASVAAHAAKTAAKRREREEFAIARRWGVAQRHVAKLSRNRAAAAASKPTDPPPAGEARTETDPRSQQ